MKRKKMMAAVLAALVGYLGQGLFTGPYILTYVLYTIFLGVLGAYCRMGKEKGEGRMGQGVKGARWWKRAWIKRAGALPLNKKALPWQRFDVRSGSVCAFRTPVPLRPCTCRG